MLVMVEESYITFDKFTYKICVTDSYLYKHIKYVLISVCLSRSGQAQIEGGREFGALSSGPGLTERSGWIPVSI